ncbi:hypothetical protein EH240_11190 [Mesorhizobium tamadayense]|uniref:Uncharacterized protein n=1 Tax=Mesorhizobium tamadayense TaxID=425306 RepID=A0A3P3FYG0_9HYPH|nr:hypothetical protein [Mesorhizobium tamadayense]RRI03123.1 hypothetical protein EH240_11190 [Mesorhizobium tamadayense]
MFFAARHKAFESTGGKRQNQPIFAPYSGVRAHKAREQVGPAPHRRESTLFLGRWQMLQGYRIADFEEFS